MIQPNYVPSSGAKLPPKDRSAIFVFYNPKDVPFEYNEIGRVFLKNINYWADRSPGDQIDKIIETAAANGADGVIVIDEKRFEASGIMMGRTAGATGGDVYQYSGLAIIRRPKGDQ